MPTGIANPASCSGRLVKTSDKQHEPDRAGYCRYYHIARDHLRFGVAEKLEMMVERSHFEYPLAVAELEGAHLQHHADVVDPGFGELQFIMKNGVSQEEYRTCKRFKTGIETVRYYRKQLVKRKWNNDMYGLHGLYRDYIHIGKDNGHDMDNPYWKWPNDLKKAHDKVVEEANEIQKAKEMKKQDDYRKAIEQYVGKEINAGKITVHVASSIAEWEHQADVLNQCIMYGGYLDDMMAGKCLLLFVLCDGEPMATAEIDRKGKIVQFYADQHADADMTPTSEANAAVKKWLKTYKPKFKEAA